MDPSFLITAFVALFVVIDPIGLAPLYVALTAGMSPAKRRAIGIRACAVSIAILFVFSLAGNDILEFAGISMPAFRIAGGILLFLTALDMLFERRQKRREDRAEEDDLDEDDPSVFPLAIPLIAGPGSITTIILLVGQTDNTVGYAAVMGVLLGIMAMVFVMFLASTRIERMLGKTGITIITRLLGMLLAALSVQFVLDGLSSFGLGN
ncbi:MarC family protein [Thalassorhabdomicrobium marinisediminis]|uniref:MarC family protein n=1 Tax=Thalassorhabdomicrobium marinisediminis TaxID=2170577 RepID=UPI00249273E8|nr:MarC family protein [Thalassorhabdomicrobium marinisediminis]